MTTYLEEYQQKLKALEDFKNSVENAIVVMFETIDDKPIHIGNMVYYYIWLEDCQVFVPAYCYESDYDEKLGTENFEPIYDRYGSGTFGWTDFSECCRIFEVIRKHLMGWS